MTKLMTFEEDLLQRLHEDKDFSTAYLQFAFENFEQNNDMPMLLHSIRRFLLARDGIDTVAQQLVLSSDNLMDILNGKEAVSFAMMQKLCGTLGYRVLLAKKEMAVQEAA